MGLPKDERPLKPVGDTSDPRGFYLLLTEHLQWLKVHNFAPATIHKRGLYVRAFALWCLERDLDRPAVITKPMLESYQRWLYRYRKANGQPLAWSGQHLHLKEVRAFFAWLVKMNHLAYSPAEGIELPKQPKTLPKAILSRELCSLRIDDVQVDRQSLFISQGKGGKDRYVPIGLRALLWIARYVEEVRSRLLPDENERALFVTNEGEPISPDTLTEYGRRYIRAAGINKPGACHIYRHTMATLMHDAGADLTLIQVILGHAKTETTQIYARTSLKRLLDVHGRTHPAERKEDEDDSESSSQG